MTHTAGPWVGFSDQGRCVAIMPAGRDGDICTFAQWPNDADARLIAAAPDMLAALIKTRTNLLGLSQSDDDVYAAMVRRINAAIGKAATFAYNEDECPGHVASEQDGKVCGNCGVHIDSLRPPEDD